MMMERLATAYGRALFPNRFGRREETLNAGNGDSQRSPMSLAPGALELDMGAAIYHLVGALEHLLDRIRRHAARWRARPEAAPRTTPLGCG
jgi:hypothetical protein